MKGHFTVLLVAWKGILIFIIVSLNIQNCQNQWFYVLLLLLIFYMIGDNITFPCSMFVISSRNLTLAGFYSSHSHDKLCKCSLSGVVVQELMAVNTCNCLNFSRGAQLTFPGWI